MSSHPPVPPAPDGAARPAPDRAAPDARTAPCASGPFPDVTGPAGGCDTDPRSAPAAACTLPPDGLAGRLAWIRRKILPHVVSTGRLAHGLALELAPVPGLAETLDHWIRLERECCATLAFVQGPGATDGSLRLEIRGLDPDGALVRALGVATGGAPEAGSEDRPRG